MKHELRSMAYTAMVLLYLAGSASLTGCGARVYEAVAEEQEPSPEDDTEEKTASFGEDGAASEAAPAKAAPGRICVYICGAVREAGVYELPEGARVYEAVEAAGGLREDANEIALNMALLLKDGQQVIIPRVGESLPGGAEAEPPGSGMAGASPGSRININTAGLEELMLLNGIGQARAAEIIAYRENNGFFRSTEDIMKVNGIKESIYEKIRDMITTGQELS